jgi:hypothetical protein
MRDFATIRDQIHFWWTFSQLKFYRCLIVHRKIRILPSGILESSCRKCYAQPGDPIVFGGPVSLTKADKSAEARVGSEG